MDILAGFIVGILGLLLVFSGYAFARILLTISGLVFGVVLGGSLVDDLSSSAFLNTTLGIVLSIVLGLVFAGLAYFFFYLAVIIAGASFGFYIGSHFLQLFGMDPNFLTAMLGAAVGVLFGIGSIVLNLPRAYLIVITAFSGAVLTIGGLLLVFQQINLDYFSYETAKAAVDNSVFWSIGALVLAVFGMIVQSMISTNADVENWQNWNSTKEIIDADK